ncbi:hypothetical protein [Paractinoplanes lichenicola]|uniref:Phage tail protein n=1 Tax=Paractinoplanes lichenicola TaxID=2802976 RepID=A0ABS1VHT5_9ACTN|nr:hypothetical protein [Actinoplanes lichenicola]MBL7254267.1 hypothetical protein [Actinoplanes lichenicola]
MTASFLAGLLDRSAARIAELSADARFFNRQEIATIADVWDNNTMSLFHALPDPARARAALAWMGHGRPARRLWMAGQPELLSETDQAGIVPGELPDVRVGCLRVEQAGPALRGHLKLSRAGVTVLELSLDDVHDARFDSEDTVGAAVSLDDGVEVRLGSSGPRSPFWKRKRVFRGLAADWGKAIFRQQRPAASLDDHVTLASFGGPDSPVLVNSAVRNASGGWEARAAELPPTGRFRLTVEERRIRVGR